MKRKTNLLGSRKRRGGATLGCCPKAAPANLYALMAALVRFASAKIEQAEAERDFYKAAAGKLSRGGRKK
jgi:hypothetical protein